MLKAYKPSELATKLSKWRTTIFRRMKQD